MRVLLAFAKLRSDVTDAMDFRNASDLLIAVGDQTSNMIHRLNNTVGAMRDVDYGTSEEASKRRSWLAIFLGNRWRA